VMCQRMVKRSEITCFSLSTLEKQDRLEGSSVVLATSAARLTLGVP
jgi:hypothetical protein